MRYSVGVIVLFLLAFVQLVVSGEQRIETSSGASGIDEERWLCRALESIEAGERRRVVLSGVLVHGYLYSPEEPICRLDVQPTTCVEFAPELEERAKEAGLLGSAGRKAVRLQGVLNGPVQEPPEMIESAPSERLAAFRRRAYCHSRSFRTKFEVEEILQVSEVPDEAPWNAVIRPPGGSEMAASVTGGVVPRYPEVAQILGVSGQVSIKAIVRRGRVVETRAIFGDPALVGDSVAFVESLRFDEKLDCEFITNFVYVLERRFSGDDGREYVEMSLPWMVAVTAAEYGW